jgi:hypothetical protein
MANNFLTLGTLTVVGWVFVNGSPPSTEPAARSSALRVASADSEKIAAAAAGPVLEARQAPVPLVRNVRPPPETPPVTAPPVDPQQAQDGLDREAAKAAVEADGYRRVTVLGKTGRDAWRAKGFRGATEVLLTVDGAGRVSMD